MKIRTITRLAAVALATAFLQFPLGSAAAPTHLSTVDAGEISTSYAYLTDNFYKRVDPQVVLDSVRTELLSAMRSAGIRHIALPPVQTSTNAAGNVHAIDREVEAAAAESRPKSIPVPVEHME